MRLLVRHISGQLWVLRSKEATGVAELCCYVLHHHHHHHHLCWFVHKHERHKSSFLTDVYCGLVLYIKVKVEFIVISAIYKYIVKRNVSPGTRCYKNKNLLYIKCTKCKRTTQDSNTDNSTQFNVKVTVAIV